MAEIVIDKEKLGHGLKRGIGKTDTIFADGPFDYRLRYTACGLVSSAIYQYCLSQDIPSTLMISAPNLAIEPNMQHVVPVLGEKQANGRVVDASFSQFLGYVGLSWGYERATGHQAFPQEEIIDFNFSEHQIMADWLAQIAADFVPTKVRPPAYYDDDMEYWLGKGPLSGADKSVIAKVYSDIWNPKNMQVWQPPDRVINHGRIAASCISDGAIDYA